MALVVSGILSNLWMRPVMSLAAGLMKVLLSPLRALLL